MSRLPIFVLATALLPAALSAQTVNPPVAWEDTPGVRLNAPGGGVARVVQSPAAMAPRPVPAATARPAAIAPVPAPVPAQRVAALPPPLEGPPPRIRPGGPPHARMVRGQRVAGFWSGPRAEVRNYGAYGLYPPAGGSRWVRYYGDALLVDDGGIVRDNRAGIDWDQYGDWAEEDGIPVYVGDGGYRPDEEDYAYVEDYSRGTDRAYANNERYESGFGDRYGDGAYDEPPQPVRTVTYRCDGYSQPGSPCGRPGWDYPPGTVITETTVTTAPVTTEHIYYVERASSRYRNKTKRLRRHRETCDCPAPAAAPALYGEKG